MTIIPFPQDRVDHRPRLVTETRLYQFELRPEMDEYRPDRYSTPTPFGWFLLMVGLMCAVRP
jgi:hypothetical protein